MSKMKKENWATKFQCHRNFVLFCLSQHSDHSHLSGVDRWHPLTQCQWTGAPIEKCRRKTQTKKKNINKQTIVYTLEERTEVYQSPIGKKSDGKNEAYVYRVNLHIAYAESSVNTSGCWHTRKHILSTRANTLFYARTDRSATTQIDSAIGCQALPRSIAIKLCERQQHRGERKKRDHVFSIFTEMTLLHT